MSLATPCALAVERMLIGVTQDVTQNFHASVKREEVLPTQVVWSIEKKVQTRPKFSLSSSGHTGCHQTFSLIYNRTPLNNLCKLLFTKVCKLFRTLAAGSEGVITKTAINKKGNSWLTLRTHLGCFWF